MRDHDPSRSVQPHDLYAELQSYRARFCEHPDRHSGTTTSGMADLESMMASYSTLVTSRAHTSAYHDLERTSPKGFTELVHDLRVQTARCASVAEKDRAHRLLDGDDSTAGYFDNIEACIEEEFGACRPSADSVVMLVGSGAFPMTALYLARRTGATVIGVDIDAEAVDLARRVIQRVGPHLKITVDQTPAPSHPAIAEVSHIIISSTIAVKYALLQQLHAPTRDDVIVAMRFGDGLKSVFNFPREPVDPGKWVLNETLHQPGNVFDVALYAKAESTEPAPLPAGPCSRQDRHHPATEGRAGSRAAR